MVSTLSLLICAEQNPLITYKVPAARNLHMCFQTIMLWFVIYRWMPPKRAVRAYFGVSGLKSAPGTAHCSEFEPPDPDCTASYVTSRQQSTPPWPRNGAELTGRVSRRDHRFVDLEDYDGKALPLRDEEGHYTYLHPLNPAPAVTTLLASDSKGSPTESTPAPALRSTQQQQSVGLLPVSSPWPAAEVANVC